MSRTRRIAATLAATTAAALTATAAAMTASAVAAEPQGNGPEPLAAYVQPVDSRVSTWVNLYWVTDVRICAAKVRVTGPNVDVSYPSNTQTYTSFEKDDTLPPGNYPGRTAFRVTAKYDEAIEVPLRARISWTNCAKDAPVQTAKFWVSLPVYPSGDNNA